MPTDDVLERANDHAMVYAHFHSASSDYHQVTFHLIAALAAEVRELHKLLGDALALLEIPYYNFTNEDIAKIKRIQDKLRGGD